LVVEAASLPAELEPLAWTCGGTQAVSLDQPTLLHGPGNSHRPSAQQAAAAAATGEAAAATAAGSAGLIMALRHKQRPHYGLQFHPESIATRYGVQLLYNFRDIASRHSGHSQQQHQQQHGSHLQQQYQQQQQHQLNLVGPPGRELPPRPWPAVKHNKAAATAAASSDSSRSTVQPVMQQQRQQQQQPDLASLAPASVVGDAGLQLLWRKLPGAAAAVSGGSAVLFHELVGPGPDTFWLDRYV